MSSEDKQLINTIYDTLTFNDTSKAFINGRFDKNRVTKVRIAKVVEDTELPTLKILIGFRQFIESVLNNYDYSLIDDRPTLKEVENIDKNVFDGIELHEHQLEALKKALNERRGIVKSPPGTGKCVAGDANITIEFDDDDDEFHNFLSFLERIGEHYIIG